jgi:beta-glucanase (GH16 family)
MTKDYIDDDDFFEFEPKDLDVDTTFDFTCKFKIVDMNGYKLHIHKIFKRSLSKKNLELLEILIQEKFPLTINDVSGLNIENFTINKLYDGEFELSYLTDGTFDLYLGGIIEKE